MCKKRAGAQPSLESVLVPPQVEDEPAEESVTGDDADHDAHPLACRADRVAVVLENGVAVDQALALVRGVVHARAFVEWPACRRGRAGEVAVAEFVDHHALEDIGLVVDVVEDVAPEWIQGVRWDEEATCAHPEAVGESRACEGDDEDGNERADQDDQRLGSD